MTEVLLIVGMMVVTFGVRYPVLALLGRIEIPQRLQRALRFVPVAVLSALAAPLSVIADGQWFVSFHNPAFAGSVAAVVVAVVSRHLLLTMATGMLVFVLVKLFY